MTLPKLRPATYADIEASSAKSYSARFTSISGPGLGMP
jgi:hypothetical protein